MRLLVVSSVGGHLTEVLLLKELLERHEVVLVVNDEPRLPDFKFARVYKIAHAERDVKVLLNFAEAAQILLHERPDVVLSMGAGPAVPFFFLARMLGVTTIYIETLASIVRPSLTGKMVHGVVDSMFYQWPRLAPFFPKGRLISLMGVHG